MLFVVMGSLVAQARVCSRDPVWLWVEDACKKMLERCLLNCCSSIRRYNFYFYFYQFRQLQTTATVPFETQLHLSGGYGIITMNHAQC